MRSRGFTLVEVIVALTVIALGVGGLLTVLASAADNTGYMREKTFAQWIALNRITELRTGRPGQPLRPETGVSRDMVEYAGASWYVEQDIQEAGIGELLRVDVRVGRAPDEAGQASRDGEYSWQATAVGFLLPRRVRASGLSPDWGFPARRGKDGARERDGDAEEDPDDAGPPGGEEP